MALLHPVEERHETGEVEGQSWIRLESETGLIQPVNLIFKPIFIQADRYSGHGSKTWADIQRQRPTQPAICVHKVKGQFPIVDLNGRQKGGGIYKKK